MTGARQWFICPFCQETIVETDVVGYDADEVEIALGLHIDHRHPIRWRLSPRFRRAVRQFRAGLRGL